MRNGTFGTAAAVVSWLATSVAAGGIARRSAPPPAFALLAPATAPAPASNPSCFKEGGRGHHHRGRTRPRSHPATRAGGRRRGEVLAFSGPAAAGAGAGTGAGRVFGGPVASALTDYPSRPRKRRHRRQQRQPEGWGQGGSGHRRRCFAWTAGFGGGEAGRSGRGGALAAAASEPPASAGAEGGETGVDRCIRRLDVAVRRVFADYYSCTDVRETTGSLGVFLEEAAAVLDLAPSSSSSSSAARGDVSAWPAHVASLLEARLLESSEQLNYHLDGDEPMLLYRLWIRGRAIDVYERDLLHCPRWIELVAETKKQVDDAQVVVEGRMGTVCYPSGDIFEGQVDSLLRFAKAGETPPASAASFSAENARGFVDAEMASSEAAASAAPAASRDPRGSGGDGPRMVTADVRTISGLVSLAVDCLKDGLSDEATIMQRHFRSPDFGHPLLRLASPSANDPDHPHMPDDPEMNPALSRAEEELTEDQLVQGERRAKELMHDRRRAQLDVYLICAAYRKFQPLAAAGGNGTSGEDGWNLHEEDACILEKLLREAAAIESPS
ncbi:unnamed protein product [Hapterophycus canaliculatus]